MSNFDICLQCIEGKITNKRKTSANKGSNILGLIHTNVYGLFIMIFWDGQIYFVKFIDNYSHYGYYGCI